MGGDHRGKKRQGGGGGRGGGRGEQTHFPRHFALFFFAIESTDPIYTEGVKLADFVTRYAGSKRHRFAQHGPSSGNQSTIPRNSRGFLSESLPRAGF